MIELKLARFGVKLKDLILRLSLASLNSRSKRNLKRLDDVERSALKQRTRFDAEEKEIAVRLDAALKRAERNAEKQYIRVTTQHDALDEFEDLMEKQFVQRENNITQAFHEIRSLA